MQYLYEQVMSKITNRGYFVPLKKFVSLLPYEGDLYRSFYGYHPRIKEHLNEGGTISDFDGPFSVHELIADFDGHDGDLSEAYQQLQEALMKLVHGHDVPMENVRAWFSGGGFHLSMPASLFGTRFAPSKQLPSIVRNTMMELFPDADNIYDKARLIRVGNSLNVKRGYYKVPLIVEDVINGMDMEQITRMGESPIMESNGYTTEAFPVLADEVIITPKPAAQAPVNQKSSERMSLPDLGTTDVVTCMHHLYRRGPEKGRRHQDLLRLISHWRRQNMTAEVCYDAARAWLGNNQMDDGELEKLVKDVFTGDYRYGCQDKIRLEFCDKRCIFYEKRNEGSEVANQEEMNRLMMEEAIRLAGSKPFNLADHFSLPSDFMMYPGELVTIIGDTGVNKSALAQVLALQAHPRKIIYATTEMSKLLLYRRFHQQSNGMSKDEVNSFYLAGKAPPGQSRVSHISCTDEKLTVQKLYKHIMEIRPELLIVDVIEDIGNDSDPNTRIDQAAIGLSWLARNMGIVIININHIRKQQGMPLDINSSKGPKSLVQKSDKVLAMLGDRNDPAGKRTLKSLKSRDESPFKINLIFDKVTFNIKQTKHGNHENES